MLEFNYYSVLVVVEINTYISTQVEVVFEVWLEIVLKINFHGWVAGSIETKAISAYNLKLKLKLTEAELGN